MASRIVKRTVAPASTERVKRRRQNDFDRTGPVLTDEDEAILDAAWERVASKATQASSLPEVVDERTTNDPDDSL